MYITDRVVCTTDKVNVYKRQMAFSLATERMFATDRVARAADRVIYQSTE